jgi:hypothetical protein
MSKLNFFHLEILSFLQNNPAVPRSQQDLSLDEILEEYCHLIGQPSTSHLERLWLQSFSEKEFASVGLSDYFPRIYRGLPRLYNRSHPTQSRIMKNFTHLPSLKKRTLDKALYSLYEPADPSWMKVSIFTWVMPDGLGDWVAALNTARVIQEKWPALNIQLFFVSSRPLSANTDFPTTYISYDNDPLLTHFSLEVKKELRDCDLILQIPTFFPGSQKLFEDVLSLPSKRPPPSIKNIGEYGFVKSSWFHPKSDNSAMGLHALEKGVFVHKPFKTSFADIEHKPLLEWLFHTSSPERDEIDAYRQKHSFHLAYLTTPVGGAIYLHSLLKMQEQNSQNIDLCCPDIRWLIQWIERRNGEGLPLLQEHYGVKAIEIWAFGQKHQTILQETGKILRIYHPSGLSPSDLGKLFALSDEWVAVRGNQSFSEAVSAGKMFFYDGRNHNRSFVKDILAMANNRLRGHPATLEAFRMMGEANLWNLTPEKGEWVDESYFQEMEKMDWFVIASTLGATLQDPDTREGFQQFCSIVREEHPFNSFLTHLVQRTGCHAKYPMLRQMEALQINLYLHEATPFPTLVTNLTEGLSHGFCSPQ